MPHRIELPGAGGVAATPGAAPECRTPAANAPGAVAYRAAPLATAAGLVAVTASSWRVNLVPALGVVTGRGDVRRTWSRGPRR